MLYYFIRKYAASTVMYTSIKFLLMMIMSLTLLSACSSRSPVHIFKIMDLLQQNGILLKLDEKTDLSIGESYNYLVEGEKSKISIYVFDSEKERLKAMEEIPWIYSDESVSYNNIYITYTPFGEVEKVTLPEKINRAINELKTAE
ncbi:hypothetical protein [Chengkuizengella marina]|uniref:Lipoprotein n=1 Tax=Chengkuizengella marina TaxID=2507566 RepID=A0A6N9Q517_9BACL|nr:hypothetical protein [Chengkuizengella marina]NBI29945.1 hypothetical protein [Chengkuizengella marina]